MFTSAIFHTGRWWIWEEVVITLGIGIVSSWWKCSRSDETPTAPNSGLWCVHCGLTSEFFGSLFAVMCDCFSSSWACYLYCLFIFYLLLLCWWKSADSKIGDRRKNSSGLNNDSSDAASLMRGVEDRSCYLFLLLPGKRNACTHFVGYYICCNCICAFSVCPRTDIFVLFLSVHGHIKIR